MATNGHVASNGLPLHSKRHLLLPVLHAIQERIGWISPGALNYASLRLSVPPAEAHGVASFYEMFSLTPRPPVAAHVCDDIACLTRGAEALCAEVERKLGSAGKPFLGGKAIWQRGSCLGLCERAPAALITVAGETSQGRVLMEGDPFSILEGMTIAAFATGAKKGFIYIRGEYPFALERLQHAIHAARAQHFLGDNILGHGFSFDIEIRRGAGAYICGEETALFNSIEGYRGEPRNKPPFPTQSGLFVLSTVVNNVETLINIPEIILGGGAAYARIGKGNSAGYRLFCVSGHVVRPGVYETPYGPTIRSVIDMAGGVGGTGRLQAVLLGGAAGSFVSPMELDTPLTFEGTRAIGATLGSGVVLLFDDSTDLKQVLLRIAAFFRGETCGQCVPCRVGTTRQEELLQRLVQRKPLGSNEQESALLKERAQAMRDPSLCGLGQTASGAILSAMDRWSLFL